MNECNKQKILGLKIDRNLNLMNIILYRAEKLVKNSHSFQDYRILLALNREES